jgi:hypothetical protein
VTGSRRAAAVLGALVVHLIVSASSAAAFDRTNIPLKNWGGFAVSRDALYDDLERLVASGLVGRVVLNSKPLSRIEAARVVARAIEAIRADTSGRWDDRRDLEPVLDRLRAELRSELAALGVRANGESPGYFSFAPVDRAQVRGVYASRERSMVTEQGLRFQDGWNGGATFESRAQVGDFLTFYLQPEGQLNEEFAALRLAAGYAKLTLWNVELLVGRDSLWWGPALHGSLILSNNAPPLDQVRIGSAEPFLLPWIGEHVGPMKLLFFIAGLEERRDFPHAKLSGMRATVTPWSFLEVGISRAVMFGGDTPPRLSGVADYVRVLFQPDAGDVNTPDKFRNNNLFAIDADLRFGGVNRFGLPFRDVRLYGEFGWDDTCCETAFIPLRGALSGIAGVHLLGLFAREIDARFEYTRTSDLSYSHRQFRSGYWTRGELISHYVGTEGEEFFARVVNRLTPNVMLGLELNRVTIGSPVLGFEGPKERRIGGAIDVSWNITDTYAAFGRYQIANVDNRNFQPDADGIDHVVRVEITRAFR